MTVHRCQFLDHGQFLIAAERPAGPAVESFAP